mmetsp:Transcript_101081/g.240889  ORF Transcript_101081/g.240889 Transcript_101081/m.240889 type:complete len:270 (-) Transcript_101081:55-864(-)
MHHNLVAHHQRHGRLHALGNAEAADQGSLSCDLADVHAHRILRDLLLLRLKEDSDSVATQAPDDVPNRTQRNLHVRVQQEFIESNYPLVQTKTTRQRQHESLWNNVHTQLRSILSLVKLDGQMASIIAIAHHYAWRALSNNDAASIQNISAGCNFSPSLKATEAGHLLLLFFCLLDSAGQPVWHKLLHGFPQGNRVLWQAKGYLGHAAPRTSGNATLLRVGLDPEVQAFLAEGATAAHQRCGGQHQIFTNAAAEEFRNFIFGHVDRFPW